MKEQFHSGVKPRQSFFSIVSTFIVVIAISGIYLGFSTAGPLGYVIIGGSVVALCSGLNGAVRRRYGKVATRVIQVPAEKGQNGHDSALRDNPPVVEAPSESATPSVFNIDYLVDSMDGDHESVIMILDVFIDEHSDDGIKLRQALIAAERDQAQMIAHSLKGVSASLGAESLRLVAEQLEQDVYNGVEKLQPLCQQLDKELAKVQLAVNDYLTQNREGLVDNSDSLSRQPTMATRDLSGIAMNNDVVIEEFLEKEPRLWAQQEHAESTIEEADIKS